MEAEDSFVIDVEPIDIDSEASKKVMMMILIMIMILVFSCLTMITICAQQTHIFFYQQ